MKKAKLMLTGITVLAVVGGLFAFKAAKFNQLKDVFIEAADGKCTLKVTLTTTIPALGTPIDYSLVSTTDPCPGITYTTNQQF